MIRYIIMLLIILPNISFGAYVKLTDIQISNKHGNSQIILSSNHRVKYHYFVLSKPHRLVVDLVGTKYSAHVDETSFSNTMIVGVRNWFSNNKLRLVFELRENVKIKSYIKDPNNHSLCNITFDLLAKTKTKSTVVVERKITEPTKLRKAVVIIDPGHGGKDPGAIGLHRTREKTVVLAISKELYRLLKKEQGVKSDLTRRSDYYIPLRGRLQIARKNGADLFISVHADAYKSRTAHGASVFALSGHGATSEAARWLANSENHSELMGDVELGDKSYVLRSVLLNLSQTATIKSSLNLGYSIISALNKVTSLHSHRVEQAGFVVLKSPDIPSVLVETGFIVNPHEELLLRSSSYQRKIAHALLVGIMKYFHRYQPRGTIFDKRVRISKADYKTKDLPKVVIASASHLKLRKNIINKQESHQKRKIYIVRRGDTLSNIAKCYKISLAELMKYNHLSKKDRLLIGQRLKLPDFANMFVNKCRIVE